MENSELKRKVLRRLPNYDEYVIKSLKAYAKETNLICTESVEYIVWYISGFITIRLINNDELIENIGQGPLVEEIVQKYVADKFGKKIGELQELLCGGSDKTISF